MNGGTLLQAANFIKSIGIVVNQLIGSNYLAAFFTMVMTVFFTLSILGKLSYRENGG